MTRATYDQAQHQLEANTERHNRRIYIFYYETLARLISRALSRKWLTHCARDRWVVGMLNHFLSYHLNDFLKLI